MKIIGYILLSVLVLLLVVIGVLPTFFSTETGKKVFISLFSKKSGSSIYVDKLSLSWFGSQDVQGLKVEKKDTYSITCNEIQTTASLWNLLFSHNFKELSVDSPYAKIYGNFQTAYVAPDLLQKAGFLPDIQIAASLSPHFSGTIHVANGTIEVLSPGIDPILFQNIQASVTITDKKDSLQFDLSGNSQQKNVSGDFTAKGEVELTSSTPSFSLVAKANSLPVRGLDQLLSLKDPAYQDLLFELLGPKLNLDIAAKASSDTAFATVNISSLRMQAQLKTQSQKDIVTLTAPGTINLSLSPAFADKFANCLKVLENYSLAQEAKVQILLNEISVPIVNEKIDFQNLGFIASLDLSSLMINAPTNDEVFTLTDLHADLSSDHLKEGVNFAMNASSKIGDLNISNAHLQLSNGFSINAPIEVTFTPSASFFTPMIPKMSNAQINIQKLNFPQGSKNVDLQAELSIPFLSVHPSFASSEIPIENFVCQINATSLDAIALHIESTPIKADFVASLEQNPLVLNFTGKSLVEVEATNDLMQTLLSQTATPLTLLKPTQLQVEIAPFSIDFSSPSSTKLIASAKIPELDLQSDDKELILQNISLEVQSDGYKESALIDFRSNMQSGGSFVINAALNKFSFEKGFDPSSSTMSLSADFADFPSTLLETFLAKDAVLQPLVGPTFNLHLDANCTPKNKSLQINAQSPLMQMSGSFAVVNHMLQMSAKDPFTASFTLTEEGYNLITSKQNPFALKEPSSLKLSLSRLIWPLDYKENSKIPSLSTNLSSIQMVGNLEVDNFSVFEKNTVHIVSLNSLTLNIEKATAAEPLLFSIQGSVQSHSAKQAPPQKGGDISIDGKIDKIFNENGQLDLSHLYTDFKAEVVDFPVMTLDALSQIAGQSSFPFATVFGNTINATASAQIQDFSGPVNLNINSQNTRASLVGRLQNGRLLLDETIHAQLTLTPELSKFLISEVNPLRITALSSKNPITFEISPQGFSLPLSPFSMENVNIPNMRIELGQISCHNEGNINVTLGLLKSKQLTKEKDLKLWFAPIDVHIKQGIVDCERTEILVANTFEIAIWGTVDLVKNYVDMILGLTTQCLEAAFGIKGLPENYVLQIPMKGKTDDVEINTSKATAKIALLLAWQQKALAGALGGGKAGQIFGEVLGKVATLPDSDSKAPPPKHPFPWEKKGAQMQNSSNEVEKTFSKKRRIKKGDKPLKQLLKILKP